MVVFRPLRGCRYNSQVVGDLSRVLCPPYDMIGHDLQQSLQSLSPYNAVHLEGGEEPDPNAPPDAYLKVADLFQEWLGQGVMCRDEEPSFYLMRHGFQHGGQSHTQLALFGGVRLEEYDAGQVLAHENTREPAVLDRVALMEACKANVSPIMGLYRDEGASLSPVFRQVMATEPVLDVSDSPEGPVTLWRVSDPAVTERIASLFQDKAVFLADGHHRYEAALRLRHRDGDSEGQGPRDFVMMALVSFSDPGLLLLPYHRTISGLTPGQLTALQELLGKAFDSRPIDMASTGGVDGLVEQVTERGKKEHILALVTHGEEQPQVLTLRQDMDWQNWGPLAVSEAWILEEKVLRPLLGDRVQAHVGYTHDHQQAAERVRSGELQGAFLLKPFPLDAFQSIVSRGQRLPAKSTFFYPKLPTGLVINQIEGAL